MKAASLPNHIEKEGIALKEITPNENTPNTSQKPKKKANWLQWVMILSFAVIGFLFAMLMVETMDSASLNGASDGQVMLLWLGLMVVGAVIALPYDKLKAKKAV